MKWYCHSNSLQVMSKQSSCYCWIVSVLAHNSSFFKFSTVTSTRGHQYKLYKSHCSHSTCSRFFAERVINVWNCLPPSVDYSTLETFRRSIDGVDFTSSLKCDTDWVHSYIIGQLRVLCVLLFLSFIFFQSSSFGHCHWCFFFSRPSSGLLLVHYGAF